uniref:Uncharacterized protein n=1 Tax=Anguilla anguilla TaxID=7936 RepID=A0A0E9QMH3_ANGAN
MGHTINHFTPSSASLNKQQSFSYFCHRHRYPHRGAAVHQRPETLWLVPVSPDGVICNPANPILLNIRVVEDAQKMRMKQIAALLSSEYSWINGCSGIHNNAGRLSPSSL